MVNQQLFLDVFNRNISQLQQKATVLVIALQQGKKLKDLPVREEYDLAKRDSLVQLEYLLKELQNQKLKVLVKSLKVSLLGFESALKLERGRDAEMWGGKIVQNTISLLEFLQQFFILKATSKTSTVEGVQGDRARLAG
ncbi:MAG TPA: hypothetical protein VJI32_05810 [Candidatus Nanoarchaeia archaeon]|nr:hypothetical protein [Candidatus Woesearchaeota archaeon]HIG93197.1 hypothetical protein [Candidatus Woesearchaeota archaeon]HIH13059.1 hypothetical protein [Candidatus Woesearchaeota archaeon]HLC71499.1 hypothetical protein [Candidatus Nanoarchaeia archaeon]